MRDAPGDANDRTTVERRDPLVGTVLDRRFRIDHQLAAGGFGAIYRATDVRSDAEVALKVLHPKMARDPAVVLRFRREGATLSNLRDPHTITAYELGEAPDGTLYIVMELLHGESLYEQFRASGPLPWRRVVHIARGVCSSLAEAHAAGIVHRDLKPANIHLEQRGDDLDFVKVLDFGIAKIVQGVDHDRNELTQAGHMIGTVDYMSPEQMVGGEMTPRSDIYTLGIVMYEMISGRAPFADAQTPTAILAAVLTRTPEPLSRHVPIPPALDDIVARCLAREPQARFGDITELDDALAEVAAAGLARPGAPARSRAAEHVTTAYPRQTPPEVPEPPLATPPSVRRAGRPTPPPPVNALPARATPVEFVGGLPLRPPGGVPSSGFEEVVLTSDATRIDVRVTDSSDPVLDARGPRSRLPQASTPAHAYPAPASLPNVPPAASHVLPIGHARGSHHDIEERGWQPVPHGRGSLPMVDAQLCAPAPTPPQAVMPAQAMMPSPQAAMAPPQSMPPQQSMAPPQPMTSPVPGVMLVPPPVRASTSEVPSFDMAAAANYDALVRRIIWLSLIAAVVIAILIATH